MYGALQRGGRGHVQPAVFTSLMAWQKQTDDLAAFGWCTFSLDRGFRLALTTTHQNNSDSTAWPELAARTGCEAANPSPRALLSVYFAAASTSARTARLHPRSSIERLPSLGEP